MCYTDIYTHTFMCYTEMQTHIYVLYQEDIMERMCFYTETHIYVLYWIQTYIYVLYWNANTHICVILKYKHTFICYYLLHVRDEQQF